MVDETRARRLRAELDDGSAAGPFGDLLAVWSGLADAFWLGTLRAVLAPEPSSNLPYPPLQDVSLSPANGTMASGTQDRAA